MGQQCNYKCITEINVTIYRYFKKYKYNVKTCMYTISALYQIINLHVNTYQLRPPNI